MKDKIHVQSESRGEREGWGYAGELHGSCGKGTTNLTFLVRINYIISNNNIYV